MKKWINILNNVYYYIKNLTDRQAFFQLLDLQSIAGQTMFVSVNWQQKIVYQFLLSGSREKWIFTEIICVRITLTTKKVMQQQSYRHYITFFLL